MKDEYDILFEDTKEYILRRVKGCLVEVNVYDTSMDPNPSRRGKPIRVKITPVLNGEAHPEWSVVFILDIEILRLTDNRPEFVDYYLSEAVHAAGKVMFLEPNDISYSF